MNMRFGWLFLLALAALAGCDRDGRMEALAPLLGPRWLLTGYVDGDVAHPIPTDPIPYLDVGEDWVLISNGCNRFSANHRADGEQWNIELFVIRGIGCVGMVSEEAIALEETALVSISDWTTYTIDGDTLVIPLPNGELRFRRSLPDNPAGLRAFPLWRKPMEGFAESGGLAHGRLVLKRGCIFLEAVDEEGFEDYLIVWPESHAVGFDGEGALVYQNRRGKLHMGDELVVSGAMGMIEPDLDAGYLRQETIPEMCGDVYWLMEEVVVLE